MSRCCATSSVVGCLPEPELLLARKAKPQIPSASLAGSFCSPDRTFFVDAAVATDGADGILSSRRALARRRMREPFSLCCPGPRISIHCAVRVVPPDKKGASRQGVAHPTALVLLYCRAVKRSCSSSGFCERTHSSPAAGSSLGLSQRLMLHLKEHASLTRTLMRCRENGA